jgi:hypothetical protein
MGRFVGRDPLGYVDGVALYCAYYIPNKLDPSGWTPYEDGAEVADGLETCCKNIDLANERNESHILMITIYEYAAKHAGENETNVEVEEYKKVVLKKLGYTSTPEASTSPTGEVNLNLTGNPVIDGDKAAHEAVHLNTQTELVDNYGQDTEAFMEQWTDAKKWATDEVAAYSAGIAFKAGFIETCKAKYGVEWSTQAKCECYLDESSEGGAGSGE